MMYEVFIAEDEPPIAEMIADMVHEAPGPFHVALIAHDGQTMLDILAKRPADILLSDIRMPGMDGLTLIQAARQKQPNLVCIVLTSHAEFEYARDALQKGAFDYVLKTCLPDSLNEALARATVRLNDLRLQQERQTINQLLAMPNQTASLIETNNPLPYAAYQVRLVQPNPVDTTADDILPATVTTHDFGSVGANHQLVLVCFPQLPANAESPDGLQGKLFRQISDFPDMVSALLDQVMAVSQPASPADARQAATVVRDFLDSQVDQPFDFATISDRTGYNALYLARVFKNAFGISPKRYHTQAKIALISDMLDENPHLLLKEAAAKVNFEDELYLAKVFKQETGFTFTEYRERIKRDFR